jgi:putative tryptophan/tyrosine transport system substrate-binding protein
MRGTVQVPTLSGRLSRRAFVGGAVGLGASAGGLALVGAGCVLVSPRHGATVPRIGILSGNSDTTTATHTRSFVEALSSLGYVDAQTITLDWAFSDGRDERYPELAARFVGIPVDVIVATSTQSTQAAMLATSTIPIVMVTPIRPIESGLVASLARPGGNVTGLAGSLVGLVAKRLQLLLEAVGGARRVGVLWNSTDRATQAEWLEVQAAADRTGINLKPGEMRGPEDVASALETIVRAQPEALLSLQHPQILRARQTIVNVAANSRLPALYFARDFPDDGGLMSYGPNLADLHRRAATFVDKLLKGRNPAELPVELPTAFEFVVNHKIAQALGLIIPPDVAAQVTEWVE